MLRSTELASRRIIVIVRIAVGFVLAISLTGLAFGQSTPNKREIKVREDRKRVEAQGRWLYNDLNEAYRQAQSTGKPILVVLRCIPCEECVKLDDDLVDNDPVLKPLLSEFICVRIVGTNGLDLNLFQFDTDQSFAVFMLNADQTIYGRFGTRSHRTEWLQDVSLEGMAKALAGAIELHKHYPNNKARLAGKQSTPIEFASPEKFPSLASKFTDKLNYEGEVVKSCIHCHQIGEARREFYWHRSEKIPEELLFPYPHPKSIGMVLDPSEKAKIKSVSADSPAAKSGLRVGDELLEMNHQPLLSMADVQWVLNQTPGSESSIALKLLREGRVVETSLNLPEGWRRLDDISWRVAAWQLSRIGLGGMRLESVNEQERKQSAFLKVKGVGQWGAHAAAKNAGFEKGDLLLSYDGQSSFARESDLFAYVNENLSVGHKVPIKVLRNGKTLEFTLPIQQ
jgi:serine protease Do